MTERIAAIVQDFRDAALVLRWAAGDMRERAERMERAGSVEGAVEVRRKAAAAERVAGRWVPPEYRP